MRSLCTVARSGFESIVVGNYALASVVSMVRSGRHGLKFQTVHEHAAHAVEILALRKGATVRWIRPEDGQTLHTVFVGGLL